LGIYSLNKKSFIFSDLKLTVAYQNVKESRTTEGLETIIYKVEKKKMYSVAVDLTRNLKAGSCSTDLNRIMKT
jgi:hypothetical protein